MRAKIASYAQYIAAVGLACLVVALGAWLVLGQAATWIEIVGGVGVILLASTVLLRPAEVKAALTGRQARYGGNALLMSVAFLLIVALANYLGVRHHLRWDVTAEKQYSLSEQTIQIIKGLQEPIKIKLFFTQGNPSRQEAEDMLKEYTSRSSKISYEVVDPDVQRLVAMDYKAGDGTIVFERGSRRELVYGTQETDFTSALLKVTRDQIKTVYFLTGHQERDPESADQAGYSTIKQLLQNENYKVETLNLAVTKTLPSDLAVLIVAGPQKPLSADETGRLSQVIQQGKGLLVMVEPGMADPLGGLLHTYGVDLPDDLIIDPVKSFYGDIASPLVDQYAFHQITKDIGRLTSFFPTARSLMQVSPAPADWSVQILATTSANSWGETRYREPQVNQDPDEKKGPLNLMAVIEPTSSDAGLGRLVVFGDSDLASNSVIQAVRGIGNVDLFMNSINWLASEKELISIRPKMPEQRQVVLSAAQGRAILYGSILFVPLVVLAAGAVVWWKRR
jgi:ABC-type uncharacterized transport system involved in gliding motility auxiliary subunit